jgi:hypothetical protein
VGLLALAEKILAQRIQYELAYTSEVNTPGVHTVQIRVTADGVDTVSNVQSYEIEVRAPDVTFVQPGREIVRQSEDPAQPLEALPPTSHPLRLLITFPDQHPRPLVSSQLLVDGEIVARREEPPFDIFEWDLTAYLESGSHSLQAVVVDSLGLQGTSVQVPVYVEVIPPSRGLAALRPALGPLLAALAILAAGVVLAVALISAGRARLTHATPASQTRSPRPSRLQRASLRASPPAEEAEALLTPIDAEAGEAAAVLLTGSDLLVGRDPSLSAVVLEDPSVDGMHARLIRQADGDYLLRDQGSISGTWVNYEPVPKEGRRLRHGDLVHFGRVAFRFLLSNPPPPPQIRVRADEPEAFDRPKSSGTEGTST